MAAAMAVAQWYAVQTKPRCEDQVVDWLGRRCTDLSVFLPKLEALRRWRGRKVRYVEPLFPSYLFVRMALEPAQWHAVKWTPGVKQIVGLGEVPVAVPDEAIAVLQARCDQDGCVPWVTGFHPGQPVRITHGPLAGLVGILDRTASHEERVRVLLNLLRTVAAVEVEVVDLEEA